MPSTSDVAPSAPGAIVSLAGVGVYYRKRLTFFGREKFKALSDVTLDVRNGEILGVIGRNGSGKTTLLRVIASIIHPDEGSVTVAKSASTVLLGLQLGFNSDLSGRDNAVLSSMLMGMSLREARAQLETIKDIFGYPDFFNEPLATYSSGMRARLGFAVAYCTNADVLLLDEILGVGDESFRHRSTEMMLQKIRSGNTVVLVSHNLDLISHLCDRVVLVEKGKITTVGPADNVVGTYLSGLKKKGEI